MVAMRAAWLGVLLVGWAGGALAETRTVVWPTFYRTGPDRQHRVVDELQRGVEVTVLGCEGDWCRVQVERSTGYVEQGALAAASAVAPRVVTRSDCFDSGVAGYGKGEVYRFCPQAAGR